MKKRFRKKNSNAVIKNAPIPGPALVSEWFSEDKPEAAEHVRFERTDAYGVYEVSKPKGAL